MIVLYTYICNTLLYSPETPCRNLFGYQKKCKECGKREKKHKQVMLNLLDRQQRGYRKHLKHKNGQLRGKDKEINKMCGTLTQMVNLFLFITIHYRYMYICI